jgi:hypothetical protein
MFNLGFVSQKKKLKLYIAFSRLWGCAAMYSNPQDAEEPHTEYTEVVFSS